MTRTHARDDRPHVAEYKNVAHCGLPLDEGVELSSEPTCEQCRWCVENRRDPLITQSTILKRKGWSKKSIEALLGEPDVLTRSPHGRRCAPMRLYRTSRVLAAEAQKTTPGSYVPGV